MDANDFLRRMEARDARVFTELMPTIRRLTLGIARDMRVHADLRDDLVQEVALKVFRNWRQFQGRSQLSSWIYAVARNQCLDVVGAPDHVLGRAGIGTAVDAQGGDDDDAVPPDMVDRGASDLDQRRCVQAVLAELDREPDARAGSMRKIDFLLHFVEHSPSSEELASFLKTTVAGAKERKRYLLAHLRDLCRKHCGADECGLGVHP